MPYTIATGISIHAGYKSDFRRSNKQEDGGVSTLMERSPSGFKKVTEITMSVIRIKKLCVRHQ